jgi:hypothetical protein
MTPCFHDLPGFQVETVSPLLGLEGASPLRLTRSEDGASLLLHPIDSELHRELAGALFRLELPDFSRPFITRFAGVLEYDEGLFLVEPLPPAMPLQHVWMAVLRNDPTQARAVLRELTRQMEEALDRLHALGQEHGGVSADNVVLTMTRTYGLLQAQLETPKGLLCLRPPSRTVEKRPGYRTGLALAELESPMPIVMDLLATAIQANALPQSELGALCADFDELISVRTL